VSDVKLPQLGESVTEGTLGKWLKNVGEMVGKYEPLVEIATDKVNAEIPSDFEGVLSEIFVQEGETVQVGTVICRISDDLNSSADNQAAPAATTAQASPVDTQTTAEETPANGPLGRGRFSPAVLRLADEHGVDLNLISGTGEGGRITRKDVLAFAESGNRNEAGPAAATVSGHATGATPAVPVSSQPTTSASHPSGPGVNMGPVSDDEEVIVPTSVRKTIARRMVESKHNAPHAWTMVEADVTQLTKLRDKSKADFKRKEGVDLTYLPFFIKAVVEALKQYPMLNASWVDETIRLKKRINISIAVATDEALVVPVIHDADRLSIAGIAHAVNDLAARARSGKLSLTDVQGGTFTVNNTGAFGSILSQPIINAPQAAILSVESIVNRPVVVHDAIAIRSMVNLCLSLDHRILDGWVAGQFLKAVKERLQSFQLDTFLY
jgi:2-oxoisovalerate dehydrogenase E2 component (dihydrolipoyl transacylase)